MNIPTSRLFRFLLLPIFLSTLCPSFAQTDASSDQDTRDNDLVTISKDYYDLLCIDIWMAMIKTHSDIEIKYYQVGKHAKDQKSQDSVNSYFAKDSEDLQKRMNSLGYSLIELNNTLTLNWNLHDGKNHMNNINTRIEDKNLKDCEYCILAYKKEGEDCNNTYIKEFMDNPPLKESILGSTLDKDSLMSKILKHPAIKNFNDCRKDFEKNLELRLDMFYELMNGNNDSENSERSNVSSGSEEASNPGSSDRPEERSMGSDDSQKPGSSKGQEGSNGSGKSKKPGSFKFFDITSKYLVEILLVVISLLIGAIAFLAFKLRGKKTSHKQNNPSNKTGKTPNYPGDKGDVKRVNVETQITPQTKNQVGTNQSGSNDTNTGGNNDSSSSNRDNNSNSSGEKTGTNVSGKEVRPTEEKKMEQPIPQPIPKETTLYLKPANAEGIFPEGQAVLNEKHHIAKLTLSREDATKGTFTFLPCANKILVVNWTIYLPEIVDFNKSSTFQEDAQLIVNKEGEVIKEGASWKVIKKAEVTIK